MPIFSAGSASVQIVPDFSGAQKAIGDFFRRQSDIHVTVKPDLSNADVLRTEAELNRMHGTATVTVDKNALASSIATGIRDALGLSGLNKLGSLLNSLIRPAAITALGGVFTELASSIAQVPGALALVPAALAAVAVPAATVAIGIHGISAAFKALDTGNAAKIQKAMEGLAPAARDFVTQVHALGPAWTALRLDVQQQLLAGVGTGVTNLARVALPILRTGLTQTAGALNTGLLAAMHTLQGEGPQFSTLFSNIAQTIRVASGAASPLIQAFLTLGSVGSRFLPQLAGGLVDVANKFNAWVQAASRSGELVKIIQNAINIIKQLGDIALNVAKWVTGLFSAALPFGNLLVGLLVKVTGQLAAFINSVAGQNALKAFFGDIEQAVAILLPPLEKLIQAIVQYALPILGQLVRALAPVAATLANQLAGALKIVAGIIPPVAKAIGDLVAAFAPLIPVIAQMIKALLPPLIKIVEALAPVVAQLASALGAALLQAVKALAPLLPPVANAFLQIVKALIPILAPLGEIVAALLPPLVKLVLASAPLLVAVAKAFVQVADALVPLIGPLVQLVQLLLPPLNALVKSLTPFVPQLAKAFVDFVKAVTPLLPPLLQLVRIILPPLTSLIVFLAHLLGTVMVNEIKIEIAVIGQLIKWMAGLLGAIDKFLTWVGQNWTKVWGQVGAFFTRIWTDILSFFTRTWASITSFAHTTWTNLASFFTDRWNAFTRSWQGFWNGVSGFLATIWNHMVSWVQTKWSDLGSWFSGRWHTFTTDWNRFWSNISGGLGTAWDHMVSWVQGKWNGLTGWFSGQWHNFENAWSGLWNRVSGNFATIWDHIVSWARTKWAEFKADIAGPIKFVVNTVLIGGLFKAWNAVAGFLGLNSLKITVAPITSFATGGVLPGYSPGRDSVLAALSPGEGILVPEAVRGLGGERAVHAINSTFSNRVPGPAIGSSGMPAFAGGGVSMTWPQLWSTVHGHAPNSVLTSAYRPGASDYHGLGDAIDVSFPGNPQSLLEPLAAWIAHSFPGSTELIHNPNASIKDGRPVSPSFWGAATWAEHANHVHWAMTPTAWLSRGSAGVGGALASILGHAISGAGDVLNVLNSSVSGGLKTLGTLAGGNFEKILAAMPGKLIGGMWDKIKGQVASLVSSLVSSVTTGSVDTVPSSRAANVAAVQRAAAPYGWASGTEWSDLVAVIMRESGFNNNAQNPHSTAYGIFQFLDSTWGAYTYGKTSDPFKQAVDGMEYIRGRYGDPAGALRHEQQFGWYDRGGALPPGYSTVLNGTGDFEWVLNKAQQQVIGKAVNNNQAGGDTYVRVYLSDRELIELVDKRVTYQSQRDARHLRSGM